MMNKSIPECLKHKIDILQSKADEWFKLLHLPRILVLLDDSNKMYEKLLFDLSGNNLKKITNARTLFFGDKEEVKYITFGWLTLELCDINALICILGHEIGHYYLKYYYTRDYYFKEGKDIEHFCDYFAILFLNISYLDYIKMLNKHINDEESNSHPSSYQRELYILMRVNNNISFEL